MALSSRPKALFMSHGGGPCFFMKGSSGPFSQMDADSPAAEWYRNFTKRWPKPSAIVVVSAHWETRGAVRVTSGASHPLLYDYYGFPSYTYDIDYDCPGHPRLARRIIDLLNEGGVRAGREETRGYDHGVFIPLKLMYPEADIPVIQVSLLAGLSAEAHIKIGTALRGLLEEEKDVLVVGSGQATHNLNTYYPGYPQGKGAPREVEFISWLRETSTAPDVSAVERRRRLLAWDTEAPHARLAHPREEHLLPLHVVSALTTFALGEMIYDDFVMGGMSLACVAFGTGDSPAEGSEDCVADA